MKGVGHPHHHAHRHAHQWGTGPVLYASLVLTIAFVVLEAVAGFRSGSLALLSDAGHNLTDAFGLVLAAAAVYFQFRPGDQVKTFGYHRAEVLAAFLNALTLVVISAWLLWESYRRLIQPEPVAETTMLVVASIGLALNGAIALGLKGHRSSLNIRAAFLHQIGDVASCIGIIAGALLIRYTGAKLNEVLALNPFQDLDTGRQSVVFGKTDAIPDRPPREVQMPASLSMW